MMGKDRKITDSPLTRKIMRLKTALPVFLILAGVAFGSKPNRAAAQDEGSDFINYAYATWIGTGAYVINKRRVYVIRAAASFPLLQTDDERWNLDLLLPVAFGLHDFDFLPENFSPDNFATVTFVPGLELHYRITDRWWIKPFGQIGIGKDFSGGDFALIYGGGVGTLFVLPVQRLNVSLGGRLTMARQNIIGGGIDNGFSMLELGLDLNHPLFTTRKGRRFDGGLFFIYTPFVDDLDIILTFPDQKSVRTLYQLGFHTGVDPPIDLRIVKLERFGITFLAGDSLGAIKLNSGFPF
jgi:hypothetical protein